MCGIAGLVNAENQVDLGILKKMTDAIAHRGPDGEGHWINGAKSAGFGHRRLSIIDLSNHAKQPMHYMGDRYTITYNGEIYNYVELKASLLAQGYKFNSESDTEVLLALYDLKKEACLQDLDGMFAFAIWDEKEQTLFCARDRFGEKPFYYHFIPGKAFYFASEMKALWAAGIPRNIDMEMVLKYHQQLYDSTDLSRTFFTGIKQLDGGHYLKIDKTLQPKVNRYYSLDTIQINTSISEEDAAAEFRKLLTDSVRIRMRADVPVGSSLSGGLDSSSIVMLMNQLLGNAPNQNTFSARFSGFAKDEGKHIHSVIDACKNVTCHEVWPTSEQMMEELDKVFYHQEEPFGSASIFAQWKVMQLAKEKNVTVLLDGQGADETLAGYLPYYKVYLQQLFYTNYKKYDSEWKAYTKLRGEAAIKRLEEEETFRMKVGRMRRSLLNQPMPFTINSLRNQLKRHTLMGELKVLLRYADRNAMAHSREVRLPFLSHHLVEFIFSLPDNFKLSKGWTKLVLRKAMEDMLPKDICWRIDKVGYEPPQDSWLGANPNWKNQIETGKQLISSMEGYKKNDTTTDWHYLMIGKLMTS